MQLTIEKMIYGGDGLGRLATEAGGQPGEAPASPQGQSKRMQVTAAQKSGEASVSRGKAVFVPFVLEGERVEIEVVESRPGFARGRALSLVSRSPQRVEPGCPYFGRCGGCHYQHASYEHQLAIKQQILQETLRRTAKMELEVPLQVHASPPWHYRNRTRLKVQNPPQQRQRRSRQAGPGTPEIEPAATVALQESLDPQSFGLGYFAHGSHRFVAVEQCPISSPLINRALRALLEVDEFRPWAPNVAEVELFANHDDSALLAGFYLRNAVDAAKFRLCFQALEAALPELRGAALILGEVDEDGGSSVSHHLPQILGERWLQYTTQEGQFLAGVGSFFQTNRFLVDELASTVVAGSQGRRVLDLYAGVGLFSLPLSRSFERVTAVEIAPSAIGALRANSVHPSECKNGIRQGPRSDAFEVVEAASEQFLRSLDPGEEVDLVVVDPPRAGLGENTARALAALRTPRLTYVSCDPATLARDLRPLLDAGFLVREAHLLDLFPQTFHLETVLQLER
ncbi:MAG: class I SAM-dependent RNA methyltransferase [Candidatus Korobacteraceae bacterium]